MAEPLILRKPLFIRWRSHDDVRAEAPDLEASLWIQPVQSIERRSCQKMERRVVEKSTFRRGDGQWSIPDRLGMYDPILVDQIVLALRTGRRRRDQAHVAAERRRQNL